jgi:hypothetical protein
MIETVEFPAYCAVAIAGLGDLPDTILTRSVVVRMRRRATSERVEPFRRRVAESTGHALGDRLAAWATTIEAELADAWPQMPDDVTDRDGDVWEALLAVADAAGGDWPKRAREAAVALVAESKESTPSLGVRLLTDLRTVFGERDAMTTDDILKALHELDEAPWAELVAGKPINARGLSVRLKPYGVKPKNLRNGGFVAKGYKREDLADAWLRYAPPSPDETATSATGATQSAVDGTPVAGVAVSWGDMPAPDIDGGDSITEDDNLSFLVRPDHPDDEDFDGLLSEPTLCCMCGAALPAGETYLCPDCA